MVDYNYYKGIYGGKLVEDPLDFKRLEMEAAIKIDYYTFGRASKTKNEQHLEKIKILACKLVDAIHSDESISEVKSTSIEGVSTLYTDKKERSNEMAKTIFMYLDGTGLTYNGLTYLGGHY